MCVGLLLYVGMSLCDFRWGGVPHLLKPSQGDSALAHQGLEASQGPEGAAEGLALGTGFSWSPGLAPPLPPWRDRGGVPYPLRSRVVVQRALQAPCLGPLVCKVKVAGHRVYGGWSP